MRTAFWKSALMILFINMISILVLSGCEWKKYTIEGTLKALSADTPLPNVPLRILNIAENQSTIAVTDSEGKFVSEKVKSGRYRIQSADTSAYLISVDTFVIQKDSPLTINRGTLRGIVAPPKRGLYAWIKGTWRELSGVVVYGDLLAISMKEARNAMSVPESASLLAYFPNQEWQKNNGIDWVMATSMDSVIMFSEGELRERTPMNEPKTMDPYSFQDWKLPGVYPLRGPTFSNLYAVVEPLPPNDEGAMYVLYPFWVLPSNQVNQFNQGNKTTVQITGVKTRTMSGSILDTTVQMDIFQRALQAALAALNLVNSSDQLDTQKVIIESETSSRFTQEQINRWREMLRQSRADKDTLRRRQLWRAIRDSAEGTDVAIEADRLLMRDMNNLPLK